MARVSTPEIATAVLPLLLIVAGASAQGTDRQAAYEAALNEVPSPGSLRNYHDLFCAEPHPAGTDADQRLIESLVDQFQRLGLEVERHDFWAYLPQPVEAGVELLHRENGRETRTPLPVKEAVLPEDPFSAHPDLTFGWNAYSGSGDVTGEVVYANYGTRRDFETLAELGIDLTGKVAIARYGGNYRGFKAKFAEEAGAAALIIYTDPADSGYMRGIPYPEGGWANDTYIQRGSIKTLPYPGDPLTPFAPATRETERLNPDDVALPKIPVQPVGGRAARRIMELMKGRAVPEGWQGGFPFAYRLDADEQVQVRVRVVQRREVLPSANVVAGIPGAVHPEQCVIIGCHFDAWTFGAGDPQAGTIVLYEIAKSFARAAERGFPPDRTVLFANWGAEEFGIIGSTEWCEAHRDDLRRGAVAYLNLDMAAMGPNFSCSASPSLKTLISDAAGVVPQARAGSDRTVFEAWSARANGGPRFGSLGGGSDHLGFYCHLGIPSAGISAGGSSGTSYHSAYDTLAWYRHVVGEDYEPALMLTRVVNVIVSRLASSPRLPIDPVRYGADTREHLQSISARADQRDVAIDTGELLEAIERYEHRAGAAMERLDAAGTLDADVLARVNGVLLELERGWLHEPGLRQRPWFRNLFAATDPDSGYAAWMLPALREPIERADEQGAAEAIALYTSVFERLTRRLETIERALSATP